VADKKFQVIINGQLADGVALAQTKQNIARLFKKTIEAVEPMFSGKRISIKKNLDRTTAKKYQQIIIKAGLKAGIAAMPEATSAEKTTTPKPQATILSDATLATAGSIMDGRAKPEDANIDTSAYRMDEVGIILDETPPPADANIDTSAFVMDEVGTILDETPPTAAPEIDTSNISMREVGENLTEYEPPPEVEFDLSQFSMGEIGEDIIASVTASPADIDTSKLSLAKEP